MTATPRHAYRADIDGLRAIAVLSVVFFHANVAPFAGGYVGVDVFFVISGFLISRNIGDEILAGRFSFATFYERRARRILPALFAMLLVTTAFSLFLFSPQEMARYAKSLIAATLGFSNMVFRSQATGSGYFEDGAEPDILLHTWSLGVEEQFYVLLPLLLLLLKRLRPARAWLCLSALAGLSFAWAVWTLQFKPNYTFYVVFPRAWELLAGSLLALRPTAERVKPVPTWLKETAAVAGLSAILVSVFAYTKSTPFPGTAALLPCLGSCALIWSGEERSDRSTMVARLLTLPPVVWLGLVSYSLYLWHWPVIVAERMLDPFAATSVSTVAVIGLSLFCAVLSYRFVEQPFRRKRVLVGRLALFAASGVAVASVIAVGAVTLATHGLPSRFDTRTVAALEGNEDRARDVIPSACLNWRKPLKTLDDLALCPIKDGDLRKVAFVGDSHVAQLRPVVDQLVQEGLFGGRSVIFPVSASCVLSTSMNLVKGPAFCPTFMRMARTLIEDDKVDTVLIGFSAWFERVSGAVCLTDSSGQCRQVLGSAEVVRRLAEELAEEVRELRSRKKTVILMLPLPRYDRSIPTVQKRLVLYRARHLDGLADALAGDVRRYDFSDTRRILLETAKTAGAVVYDPRASLCNGDDCSFAIDNLSLYSDDNHLAETQVGVLHDGLAAVFRKVYAPSLATAQATHVDVP